MRTILQDVRYGSRILRKNPGFTAVAVLTLALGIGATTSLFSVFYALILKPFPYPHPEQIVYVRSNRGQPLSVPDFKDIHEQNRSFAAFGVYQPTRVNFGLEQAESLPAIQCTAGVLRALDIKPLLGRWLDESDEQPGAASVMVMSHVLWMRAFNGDPEIIGRMIHLDGGQTQVIGVMPATFEFTSPWYEGHDYQCWTPLRFDTKQLSERDSHWLLGLGRLKPGVSVSAADADIKAIGAQLAQRYPATNTRKPLLVRSIREEIIHDTAAGVRPLLMAAAILMFVACTNVAGLLLARGELRQGEFGLRLAIGASRMAILQQFFSEAILLGLLGSGLGVLFAGWGVSVFRHLIPSALIIEARRAAIQINASVLLFTVTLGLISSMLAALFPAFKAMWTPVTRNLKNTGRTQTDSNFRHRFLRNLVVAQIAIAMVLAYTAILFVISYVNVFKNNQSLNTDRVISAEINLLGKNYEAVASRVGFWNTLFERIQSLPGVQYVGMTTKLPLEGGSNFDVLVDDQEFDPMVRRPLVENSGVSPDYFAAMGLGWLRGQQADFIPSEAVNIPVVINRAMSQECWPEADPIGRIVRLDETQSPFTFKVVGIVEDIPQWGAEESPLPELYYANTLLGVPEEALPPHAFLVVRTHVDTSSLIPAIRHELAAIDDSIPLANIRTMGEVLRNATSARKLSTVLLNIFMTITLFLTAIGIYSTLSYVLLQRIPEIGIRMAVGARRDRIFLLVIRQAGLWLIGGLIIGLVLSATCSFILRSFVYAVNPLNPLFLILGAVLVVTLICAACLMPALKAARVNPMEALRYE